MLFCIYFIIKSKFKYNFLIGILISKLIAYLSNKYFKIKKMKTMYMYNEIRFRNKILDI